MLQLPIHVVIGEKGAWQVRIICSFAGTEHGASVTAFPRRAWE